MTADQPHEPDFAEPAIQIAALTMLDGIMRALDAVTDLVAPDEGTPDAAAVRAGLDRARVLLTTLTRWTGAVG